MSFSSDIKQEIGRQIPEDQHCCLAETAAILYYAGKVDSTPGHEVVEMETDNVAVSKKYLKLLRQAFSIHVELEIRKRSGSRRNHYMIQLSAEHEEVMRKVGKAGCTIREVIRQVCRWEDPGFFTELLERSCCKRAFIRGAFLAVGSMSDPGKSYHFEMVCRQEADARLLMGAMEYFELHPKITTRKGKYIVYLKDSTEIVDVLNVMGTHRSLMALENIRILKDMRNSANRQYNCDSANINKMVRTSGRQMEDIRLIEERMGLDRLPDNLREMALVRKEHPGESLKDLGNYLDPPVGKSGVNHRMNRIHVIAESIREKTGIPTE